MAKAMLILVLCLAATQLQLTESRKCFGAVFQTPKLWSYIIEATKNLTRDVLQSYLLRNEEALGRFGAKLEKIAEKVLENELGAFDKAIGEEQTLILNLDAPKKSSGSEYILCKEDVMPGDETSPQPTPPTAQTELSQGPTNETATETLPGIYSELKQQTSPFDQMEKQNSGNRTKIVVSTKQKLGEFQDVFSSKDQSAVEAENLNPYQDSTTESQTTSETAVEFQQDFETRFNRVIPRKVPELRKPKPKKVILRLRKLNLDINTEKPIEAVSDQRVKFDVLQNTLLDLGNELLKTIRVIHPQKSKSEKPDTTVT